MKILLLTTMLIFASSVSAGLYKWIDSDGNVHYSQKRPRDKEFTRLKTPAPAPAPENNKPLYKSTKKADERAKTLATETAKNEKIRASNCANAKKRLTGYTIYRRFRDKDGNVTVIDDKDRAKKIKNSKQAVEDFCS